MISFRMELFKMRHEILIENEAGEIKPVIKLSLLNESLEIEDIHLSYAQIQYIIFQLELAKEETKSKLGIKMNRYIR